MKKYTNQRNLKSAYVGKDHIKKNSQWVEQGFVSQKKYKTPKGLKHSKDFLALNTSDGQDPLALCFQLTDSLPHESIEDSIHAMDPIVQSAAKASGISSKNSRAALFLMVILVVIAQVRATQAADYSRALNTSHNLKPSQPEGSDSEVRITAYQNHTFFNSAPVANLTHIGKKQFDQIESSSSYKGLLVENRTPDIAGCKKKKHGVSAGKICNIGKVEHFLKVVETDHTQRDRFTNPILGLYNLVFIKNNLKITAPNATLIYEENGKYHSFTSDTEVPASIYVASEKVVNLTTMSELAKKVHRKFRLDQSKFSLGTTASSLKSIMRENVINKIGELGLAKLAVAGTFFQDLVSNDGNWGYDEQGLVILDVDVSPSSLEEYLKEAAFVPRNIGFDFSLNTISMMKDLYQKILAKSPPILHETTNMTDEFYQTLIKLYIQACDHAISTIEKKYPLLQANDVSDVINDVLTESLIEIMSISRQNGLLSKYQRYPIDDHDQPRHN